MEPNFVAIRPTRGGSGPYHVDQVLGHMVYPIFHLVVFPFDFFFSRSFIPRKNDVEKRLGPFDVRKVLESQKHAKTRKYASQC
jgi:hypothetical protein